MSDPYDLQRFVDAQDAGQTYLTAVAELRAGRKRSHWMWFVFPQLAGLGRSETARHFALADVQRARAYLEHPVLGPRLVAAAETVAGLEQTDPVDLLGSVDAQKLQSSMTLFERAGPQHPVFGAVLDTFFDGQRDQASVAAL